MSVPPFPLFPDEQRSSPVGAPPSGSDLDAEIEELLREPVENVFARLGDGAGGVEEFDWSEAAGALEELKDELPVKPEQQQQQSGAAEAATVPSHLEALRKRIRAAEGRRDRVQVARLKAEYRREANKESAKVSRDRRKLNVAKLKIQFAELEQEQKVQKAALARIQIENGVLREEKKRWEAAIFGIPSELLRMSLFTFPEWKELLWSLPSERQEEVIAEFPTEKIQEWVQFKLGKG